MAAGAISVVLRVAQFPNGGGGFFGNPQAGGSSSLPPATGHGDRRHRLLPLLRDRRRAHVPARALARAGQGRPGLGRDPPEPAHRACAGVNTTLYKLWAFALASFMAGVAGGLLAAATGGVNVNQFPAQNSIMLLAVVLMGGIYSIWGAIVAALLLRLLPALLDDWGVSTELLTILFGVGVLQVLLTAPGGLIDQVPKDVAKLRRAIGRLFAGSSNGRNGSPA